MANGFKNLIVWQRAVDLSVKIYEITLKFPSDEKYTLTSQLRRSAGSVAANIAEGCSRNSKKEFIQFLWIAHGSLAETETHLIIANKLKYIPETMVEELGQQMEEIRKMIRSLIMKQQ